MRMARLRKLRAHCGQSASIQGINQGACAGHGDEGLKLAPLPPSQASSSSSRLTEAAGNRNETASRPTFTSAGLGATAFGLSKVLRA